MKSRLGFTIIELVVVIVIIGILAAVALPRFLGLQDKAHDAVVEGTQSALASGVLMANAAHLSHGKKAALDDVVVKPSITRTADNVTVSKDDPDFGATNDVGLDTNKPGYPVGYNFDPSSTTVSRDNNITTDEHCAEVADFLLSEQSVGFFPGISTAAEAATNNTDATFGALFCTQNAVTQAAGDSCFDALGAYTRPSAETCLYVYLPDQKPNVRYVEYDARTGKVTVGGLIEAGYSEGD